ncbi:MAG: threonine--tRNA ligase [Terracoccus sp.]
MSSDHRDLGRDMGLFATHPLAGAGLPLWLPAGAAIRDELQRLAKELAHADGCVDVYSPVLGKRELYQRSGHLTKFSQDMFPPLVLGEDDVVMLRPANCPHHALIYASSQHSYRELPIRLNELGSMFRAERSGVLSGLSRVRQISLDDTHVFCRADQVTAEAALGLRTAIRAQQILGLPVDHVRLSLRDDGDGWLGTRDQWDAAEDALRRAGAQALDGIPLELVEALGEAAFYGPKLDLQVSDRRGREETIATVQLDFNQPERFDLTYVAADNTSQRVVMIHRGTVGSMERVTAALLEHYDGRLPFWLAPTQIAVLPVDAEQDAVVGEFVDRARNRGLRVRPDHVDALGARIRRARMRRDCLIAVIGAAEVAGGTAQVTDVAGGVRTEVDRDDLLDLLTRAHQGRDLLISWG